LDEAEEGGGLVVGELDAGDRDGVSHGGPGAVGQVGTGLQGVVQGPTGPEDGGLIAGGLTANGGDGERRIDQKREEESSADYAASSESCSVKRAAASSEGA